MQQNTTPDGQQKEHEIWRPPQHAAGGGGACDEAARERQLGRLPQENCRKRSNDDKLEEPEKDHGLPPAGIGDGALEQRRPDRACHVGAARNQRERRAAVAIEPAAHINIERRVHAADTEKSHEQALPHIELPGLAAGGEHQPRANHRGTENDDPSHPHPFRDRPHHNAARAQSDPRERARQGWDRAQSAGFRRDQLERDDDDPGSAERQRQDNQHHARNDPR
jgi:hypothetical protein